MQVCQRPLRLAHKTVNLYPNLPVLQSPFFSPSHPRSGKRPLLIGTRSSSGEGYRPVLLRTLTSSGRSADQYRSQTVCPLVPPDAHLVRQPPPYLFLTRNFYRFAGEGWRNAPPKAPNNTSYYYEESILSLGILSPYTAPKWHKCIRRSNQNHHFLRNRSPNHQRVTQGYG